ncbi:hypothetical protein C4577_03900 [Candidatus Parcubacteria bacterium]|nr:MAG: hypothetical protein C4577_03900 [Candidatus Parcubacteria bacterium]
MRKINILIFMLIVISFTLEIANIYLSNKVTSNSIYASKIEQQIKDLDNKNQILKSDILNYTSFEMISSRAAELGFVENKEYITLSSPLDLAINR